MQCECECSRWTQLVSEYMLSGHLTAKLFNETVKQMRAIFASPSMVVDIWQMSPQVIPQFDELKDQHAEPQVVDEREWCPNI